MSAAPEFSRLEKIDTIGAGERSIHVVADAAERAALAARFALLGIDRLDGDFQVRRDAAGIIARGRVTAAVTQACVATGDPVAATIDEPVALRFVADFTDKADEIELTEDDCDTMGFDGAAIDLGEAAAETMALALDPFPRSPAAAEVMRAAGVIGEEEVRPANAFAALQAKLDRP